MPFCILAGFSLRLQCGQPPAAGAAAAEGGLPEGGDSPGQHPQTAELPARLQRRHPLADAAHCGVRSEIEMKLLNFTE